MYVIFFEGASNSLISDFSICDSETLDKVHSTFCMAICILYGYLGNIILVIVIG